MTTPLYGEYQARNALTALATLWAGGEQYHIPSADINHALATVRLPGRFQRVGDWLFDVAHNAAGARALAESLAATPVTRPVTALVAVLADKDWRGILDALAPVVDGFVLTQPPTAPANRAWDPAEAAAYATRLRVPTVFDRDFDSALARAESQTGTKLVTGSFHTVGDAMQRLGSVHSVRYSCLVSWGLNGAKCMWERDLAHNPVAYQGPTR